VATNNLQGMDPTKLQELQQQIQTRLNELGQGLQQQVSTGLSNLKPIPDLPQPGMAHAPFSGLQLGRGLRGSSRDDLSGILSGMPLGRRTFEGLRGGGASSLQRRPLLGGGAGK